MRHQTPTDVQKQSVSWTAPFSWVAGRAGLWSPQRRAASDPRLPASRMVSEGLTVPMQFRQEPPYTSSLGTKMPQKRANPAVGTGCAMASGASKAMGRAFLLRPELQRAPYTPRAPFCPLRPYLSETLKALHTATLFLSACGAPQGTQSGSPPGLRVRCDCPPLSWGATLSSTLSPIVAAPCPSSLLLFPHSERFPGLCFAWAERDLEHGVAQPSPPPFGILSHSHLPKVFSPSGWARSNGNKSFLKSQTSAYSRKHQPAHITWDQQFCQRATMRVLMPKRPGSRYLRARSSLLRAPQYGRCPFLGRLEPNHPR